MKLNLLIYIAPACVAFAAIVGIFALRGLYNERPVDETRTVYVEKTESGFQLIRNGEPFVIRGAGGDSYFRELSEIGGNTIRVFDSANLQEKLDEAHEHGLAVIVDIYLPHYSTEYDLYEDEAENVRLKQSIKDLVNEFKDHPALLIWNLGNEVNYPLVLRKNDFIRKFNELVSLIQETDPNHPVSTSIIGAGRKTMSSVFFHSPHLDIIAFNTFGNTKFVNRHLAQTSFLFGPRPYFFSELGPDGPWESRTTSWGVPIEPTSTVKAELYRMRSKMFEDNEDSAGLGTLFFYWGTKLERTHTWFSLFRDGDKSESINVIEALWNQPDASAELIGLDYMLLNNKGAHQNIILYPGELSHANISLRDAQMDSLRFEWEIYPEAWYSDTKEIVVENYKPIDTFISFEGNKTTFRAPVNEGPYRIFVYVYNQDGFYATTNIPFFVLNTQ